MAIVAKKIQNVKAEAISELKASFNDTEDFIFTDYRGLTVEQITSLRKNLRAKSATYKVVKNNYARIAFEQLGSQDVSPYLVGPTAIALAKKDANEVAKILTEAAKETPVLKLKGGLIGGAVYNASQIEAFAKLPGRLELISMLMSVMQGPARNLAAGLNDVPSRIVRTVKAVADKKGAS